MFVYWYKQFLSLLLTFGIVINLDINIYLTNIYEKETTQSLNAPYNHGYDQYYLIIKKNDIIFRNAVVWACI